MVAEIADRVAVMYAGQMVEDAPVAALFDRPLHPYTRGLLRSMPRLDGAGGRAGCRRSPARPDPSHAARGCRFHPRCAHAGAVRARRRPG